MNRKIWRYDESEPHWQWVANPLPEGYSDFYEAMKAAGYVQLQKYKVSGFSNALEIYQSANGDEPAMGFLLNIEFDDDSQLVMARDFPSLLELIGRFVKPVYTLGLMEQLGESVENLMELLTCYGCGPLAAPLDERARQLSAERVQRRTGPRGSVEK